MAAISRTRAPAPPAGPRAKAAPAGRWGGRALTYLVLIIIAVICGAPFVWMLSASLEPLGQIFAWPPHWIPSHPTLHNYTGFLTSGANIGQWFLNSMFVAGLVTILQTFL